MTTISNLQKAKQLIKNGNLKNARQLLEDLVLEQEADFDVYQPLLDICAFTADIESFLKFYANATDLNLTKKVHLNQFYHNAVNKINSEKEIKKLIDFFQMLINDGKHLDKFAYLSLSMLSAKLGKIENSIEINQKCIEKYILPRKKLDLPNSVTPQKDTPNIPDFIIIGTLKSGTTSLYKYLMQHPKLLPSIIKEIKFFSSHFSKGSQWYFSHFPSIADPSYLTGEASPGYFSSFLAPERIYKTIPQTKLILCLRNPTKRTLSHYFMNMRSGKKTLDIDNLLKEVDNTNNLLDYNKPNDWRKIDPCLSNSLYYCHLCRWLYFFPLKQIYIVNSEELFSSPQKILYSAFEFLGIDPFEPEDLRIRNEGNYSQVSEETYTKIDDFFQPHNQMLASLVGKDFCWS